MTAQQAIERSVSHNEIVTIDGDQATIDALTALADDSTTANGGIVEVWGTSDGGEWRVHVRPTNVQCECGDWSGEACCWRGPRAETVRVEYMPEHLRESHVEGRSRGVYPANGASRIRVSRECATTMIETDGEWCKEVR